MIVDSKLMRYVLFKKRTEKEVRQKCKMLDYSEDYTDEIIEYLKEAEYINDKGVQLKFLIVKFPILKLQVLLDMKTN